MDFTAPCLTISCSCSAEQNAIMLPSTDTASCRMAACCWLCRGQRINSSSHTPNSCFKRRGSLTFSCTSIVRTSALTASSCSKNGMVSVCNARLPRARRESCRICRLPAVDMCVSNPRLKQQLHYNRKRTVLIQDNIHERANGTSFRNRFLHDRTDQTAVS